MKRNPAILGALAVAALTGLFLFRAGSETASVPTDEKSAEMAGARARPRQPGTARDHPGRRAGQRARSGSLGGDFLERSVSGESWSFILPDGRGATGVIQRIRYDAEGVGSVEGRLGAPEPGRFFFQRQTVEGVAGDLVGHVIFDRGEFGWKIEPIGPDGSPMLVESHRDRIVCVNHAIPPPAGPVAGHAPQTHPSDIPIPGYQTIIPLQSLPGATGVIYLDFDGEEGPFTGWGDFDAEAPGVSNAQVQQVWQMVAEDFQGFELNVTTDRKVFDEAPEGRRQHVVITSTTTAAPGSGGVAYVGSFNWSGDTVCWAFYGAGKAAAEVISHETGHALGLSHDGRELPESSESYYAGHGGYGPTGWAPIMGVGYSRNLTQWSKGEYAGASQLQDDLEIIATGNNDIGYRADDAGESVAAAPHLEIAADGTVGGQGIIGTTGDVDAFRFATAGGPVVLQVDPVASNPNLDILAELVAVGSGEVIGISNPDLELAAALDGNLAAGEYLLRIRGTGRGDPLDDGYTDYGSLGSYLIRGNVAGGVAAERFSIAENSAVGTTVGFVAARADHGAAVLSWSISGGDEAGAFAIDPASGELSVASPAALDHEALSTRWDDPADIELFVTITDGSGPATDEVIRVVVSIVDVNEPPVAGDAALTLLERTMVGTTLLKVSGEDADPFDFPEFSIVSGNPEDWFAIDANSGELRVNRLIELDETLVLPLTVQVADQAAPRNLVTATVTVTIIDIADGYEPGGVIRTFFEGIGGATVPDLTGAAKWPDRPDREELLADFDGGGHGDSFGSTLRGYLIPPATGSYRFWISSDDASELWLSTSADPAGVTRIATINSWSKRYSWPNFGGQQSSYIQLTGGTPHYIEVRHKEGVGADHVAVAWKGPGIPKQLLRGLFVAPYHQNYAPRIVAGSFSIPEEAFPGQEVGVVQASDVNEGDAVGNFAITGGNPGGVFEIEPSSGLIRVAAGAWLSFAEQPIYQLTVEASDNGSPPLTSSGVVTVTVLPAGTFANPGIYQQVWQGIPSGTVAALTGSANYPYRPDEVRLLTSLDSGANLGANYGTRIRALVSPPASGSYTFHLSSNDHSVLLLGSGASAASASEIASVEGWTAQGEWTKYASQTSPSMTLAAGQRYYLEVLHAENIGNDHVQVGWTGPGIPEITVIPGSCLQPCDINEAPVFAPGSAEFMLAAGSANGTAVGTVAAFDPEGELPLYAITEELSEGVFAIDAGSGLITVADSAGATAGVHHLTVAAQDRGIGGRYPLRTASRSVVITVEPANRPPAFSVDSFVLGAIQDQPISYWLSASDPDGGGPLVFSKTGGPAWLSVSLQGELSGTPRNGDVGVNLFTVQVSDTEGASAQATVNVEVINTNDAPDFLHDPIVRPGGSEETAYTAPSLGGSAFDADGQTIRFSRVAGPAWLVVGEDGSLTGIPPLGSAGLNTFTVRAADPEGAFDEASLQIEITSAGLPLPWQSTGIGIEGSAFQTGERIEITGAGTLAGRGDELQFVWQPLGANGTISARIEAMETTGPGSRAGVMIRDSLAANSRHVFIGMTGDGGIRWVRRTTTNGNTSTSSSGSAVRPDAWVRLVRAGNRITAYKSADGSTWVQLGSLTADFPSSCYFGLAVCSGSSSITHAATFNQARLSP